MRKNRLFVFILVTGAAVIISQAAIIVPGADGSDGPLTITEDTVMDLSLATTAPWNTSYIDLGDGDPEREPADFAGFGVYDPAKWAVVFRYTEVTIAEGATVTFKNHPSRAPVVWLVSGNVVIDGTVSLNGQNWTSAPNHAEPGPGGFRGGSGAYSPGVGAGGGFGASGGNRNWKDDFWVYYYGGGGGFSYGNPSLVPLIGGSGGGGDQDNNRGGGAGAGAILIACSHTTRVDGQIRANGGEGMVNGGNVQVTHRQFNTGGGSGGGIRIVTDTLAGTGTLQALRGGGYSNGSLGRIRIERVTNDNELQVIPDPSLVDLAMDATALIWPPNGAPAVEVVSIGGLVAPQDPRASLGTAGADVTLHETDSVDVILETRFVEPESTVEVRIVPRFNTGITVVEAQVDPSFTSEDPEVLRWRATLPATIGFSAIQASVTRP